MLPSANRMRSSADFQRVTRSRNRARRGPVVVYVEPGLSAGGAPLVGLVVGKGVGGSVVRHAVSRRLRAQLSSRVDRLPSGSGTVVRALPEAAAATSAVLGRALDAAFAQTVGPRDR